MGTVDPLNIAEFLKYAHVNYVMHFNSVVSVHDCWLNPLATYQEGLSPVQPHEGGVFHAATAVPPKNHSIQAQHQLSIEQALPLAKHFGSPKKR